MFILGFFVGIRLSPFWISVTLMTHHVKPKTQLKSKNDYRFFICKADLDRKKEHIGVGPRLSVESGRVRCYGFDATQQIPIRWFLKRSMLVESVVILNN
jgi:hypothetical protein